MSDKSKFGSGHAKAMFLTGLDELRNSMYADSNVAQKQAAYGIWGKLTPGQIAEEQRDSVPKIDNDPNRLRSVLNEKLQELQSLRDDPRHDSPQMDLDR